MAKEINPNLVLAGGAVLLVFLGGRSIFQKLGLSPSNEDLQLQQSIQQAQQSLSSNNYFDPQWWKKAVAKYGTALILKNDQADGYAKLIYQSKGIFNDDESQVYGVFEQLKTKSQVSYLADRFYAVYKQSLLQYLNSFLNDKEMLIVFNITSKKPEYKL